MGEYVVFFYLSSLSLSHDITPMMCAGAGGEGEDDRWTLPARAVLEEMLTAMGVDMTNPNKAAVVVIGAARSLVALGLQHRGITSLGNKFKSDRDSDRKV